MNNNEERERITDQMIGSSSTSTCSTIADEILRTVPADQLFEREKSCAPDRDTNRDAG